MIRSAITRDALQRLATSSYDLTALYERPIRTADGAGGYTTTMTTISVAEPVRMWRSTETSIITVATRPIGEQRWKMAHRLTLDTQSGDRVTIGGMSYRVIGTNESQSSAVERIDECVRDEG